MPDTVRTSGFAELVCADTQWLRAEFAAIVAANFGAPAPPPLRPRRGCTGPRRRGRTPRTVTGRAGQSALEPPTAVRAGSRQRSPPSADASPCAQFP
ncbi:hypothetical protein [Amycolatopsis sp.]|uniref:hypothetical protein n=1 Tax=Amycolatopsis sp. TaxID=37632 RepID=UPI002C419E8D|nr:hypothetical protein [Amycolatopsis sp.]HVV08409.1 hypothetical protein [Amycolatopsis sp.]